LRKIPHSNCKEREQGHARGVQEKLGAAEPDDRKIADQQIANGATTESGNQREDEDAKEVNAFAASSENAGYCGNGNAKMFETPLKGRHWHGSGQDFQLRMTLPDWPESITSKPF
jgi:hypothetical protein